MTHADTSTAAQVDASGEVSTCALAIVGCGNLLRGDDGVGPVLVRHLWEGGIPDDVRLVDGGTAGMDVAFQMRGAQRVIIVDAATTGEKPGTIYKIPGPEVENLPPLSGLHTHMFRWDNALAFARWLLGEDYPSDVTVYLIEAKNLEIGTELSQVVRIAMGQVIDLIRREQPFMDAPTVLVEFADGSVRLNSSIAKRWFPGDATVALAKPGELWLVPLHGTSSGGLLLKHRNVIGDRTVLVREVLHDEVPIGLRTARWDPDEGALRITLERTPVEQP